MTCKNDLVNTTRPDTRQTQSRCQGPYLRTVEHLGRSSKVNSRKSVTWSAVPDAPYVGVCGEDVKRGAAAPEGPMTYDST